MPVLTALGAYFVALDGTAADVTVSDKPYYKATKRVEATIDCAIVALPAAGTITFFGKDAVGWKFQITSAGIVSFASTRVGGTTTTTATVAVTLGKRTIFHGIDDGTSVKLYVNGTQVGTTGTAQTGAITVDANRFYVGHDVVDVVYLAMKVFAFQFRLNDEVVGNWVAENNTGTAIRDLSAYANSATISGTENTNFYRGPFWSKNVVSPGSQLL